MSAVHELALRILDDKGSPPVLLLAAWRCVYLADDSRLVSLVERAVAAPVTKGDA